MSSNNRLLIDYGNTCIKAAVYDVDKDEIVEIEQCEKTIYPRVLLSKFRSLSSHLPTKIIEVASARSSYTDPFNNELKKLLNVDVQAIDQFDFKKKIDLSQLDPDVVVGPDILAATYYLLTSLKQKDCAIFCFGTVYFAAVVKDGKPANCLFVPSISKGLDLISNDTTIVKDLIPKKYDKQIGLNTPDAFSAGANIIMEGFINEVCQKNKIPAENVIITGGDAFKFGNINEKYKRVDNAVLLGVAQLVKDKGW